MKIEVEDGLSAEQQDTVKAFALAVKQKSKLGLEIWQFSGRWANVSDDGFFLLGAHYRIKRPTAEDYLKGHEESGLKVGDRVRVVREPSSPTEQGWSYCLGYRSFRSRDDWSGQPHVIRGDRGIKGFECDGKFYPHFVLKKIEPVYRPWTPEESVGKTVRKKQGGELFFVTHIDDRKYAYSANEVLGNMVGLLDRYEQPDGTPCGVIEGGEA